jgi:protein-tyrosine-phosphatase
MCRSPMAEALLRKHLAAQGVDAHVHSAGLLDAGRPATDMAIETLASAGLDLSPHRSRQIEQTMITGADLVLGMAQEHVREVVLLDPDAWPKAFTLKEVVRNAETTGERDAHESIEEWLARVGADRTPTDLLDTSGDDDIADPIGRPAGQYRRTADEIDELLARFVKLAWPEGQGRES